MIGQDFRIYCIEPSTLLKALMICCITPRVTTPATIAGAKKHMLIKHLLVNMQYDLYQNINILNN